MIKQNNHTLLSAGITLCMLTLPLGSVANGPSPSAASPVPTETSQVRGLLKPLREATLSSEILAKIVELPFTEGKHFKKGDILVRFDCARYKAELSAAGAEYTAKKKNSDNNAELASYNAAATLQVEVSEAETAKAAAQADAARAMVNGCAIHAPWNGRVEETIAHAHETVSPGKELVRILDDSKLEISVLVPSKWLTALKTGAAFRFLVDETGKEYPAKVTELGARVDPVSQTVRLTGGLVNPDKALLAGMSGSAHFDHKP
jgi:RND family efflux transporter MFP subunit